MDVSAIKVRAAVIACALFIVWELVHHVFLMHAPMLLQHGVAVVVETIVAAVVISIVFRLVDEMDRHRRVADRLARVIAEAVAHNVKMESAVTNITTAARMIEQGDHGEPLTKHAEVILAEVGHIRDVMKSLQALGNAPEQISLY